MTEENNGTGQAIATRGEVGFLDAQTEEGWALVARKAKALSESTVIPEDYRGKPQNVLVAMEMAQRIDLPVLAVMQNLHIIRGRPSWSSQFLITAVNRSGRFSPLRFRFEGETGEDEWGCRAVAVDLEADEELAGSLVTIGMAKAEGWYGRNGSKWKTMPEQMLRYRSAAFWARAYCPELTVGLHTADEVEDFTGAADDASVDDLNARIAAKREAKDDEEPEDDVPDAPVGHLAGLIQRAKNAKGITKPEYEEYEVALADARDGKLTAEEVVDVSRDLSRLLIDREIIDEQESLV